MNSVEDAVAPARGVNRTLYGILLASIASVFWGAMGIAVQYLFENTAVEPLQLVGLRLLAAGLLLILLNFIVARKVLLAPFSSPKSLLGIGLSGIEVLCAHLTFFIALYYSNAGTAAIFLGLVPLLAGFYLMLTGRKKLTGKELFCCALAFIGVFLIVSKGDLFSFELNWNAVFWGLCSAVAAVIYSIQPKKLIDRWSVIPVVSWGILCGGIVGFILAQPWKILSTFTAADFLAFAFIVVFGTVAAFWLYLESLKYLSPVVAGLVVCLEPLSAFLFGVWFLGLRLGGLECLGIAMVLANVIILSLGNNRPRRVRAQN